LAVGFGWIFPPAVTVPPRTPFGVWVSTGINAVASGSTLAVLALLILSIRATRAANTVRAPPPTLTLETTMNTTPLFPGME
jgi:hypothetical protein